eukprot:9490763-Pyramimonas_sp.AAC.1
MACHVYVYDACAAVSGRVSHVGAHEHARRTLALYVERGERVTRRGKESEEERRVCERGCDA